MGERSNEQVLGCDQLARLIHDRLRHLGELQVRAEIVSARPSSDGGFQLEFGGSPGHNLRGYVPGRLREQLDETLAHEELSCDDVLQTGHEVVLRGCLQYKPSFNHVELVVSAVRPQFARGMTAKQRDELRMRLHAEGVRPQRLRIERAFAPKRIGVISGRNAAGLEDFESILRGASFAYDVQPELIPLLGQRAPVACRMAIERLASTQDLIVLVRGGGATGSFTTFDDEALVRAIATCKRPIVSGLGHERDRCLTDEFAFFGAVSPSDAAHTIIGFSQHDERELVAVTRTAQSALGAALARGRAERTKWRVVLIVAALGIAATSVFIDHPLAGVLLGCLLVALLWIVPPTARLLRGTNSQRIDRPGLPSPEAGLRWLREVPNILAQLNERELRNLQELVEAVRANAIRMMR